MNEKNLIPFSQLAESKQREIRSKGGKKCVETKRKKKELRECLNVLLEQIYSGEDGDMSGAEKLAATAFAKAVDGDPRWWELVRDTAGQKPTAKSEVEMGDKTIDAITNASQLSMADKLALIKAANSDLKGHNND